MKNEPAKRGRTPKKQTGPNQIKKSKQAINAAEQSHSDFIKNIDRDKVLINGIEIDIEKITDEQLYSLRKVLPRKDYRYHAFCHNFVQIYVDY